jgi:phosphoribosylanthranilate isomerase
MVRIKICGITNWPDAQAACEAGANLLGFNFYDKSLRRVSTADAAQIGTKLPKGVEGVGVFVNSSPAEIASVRSFVRFSAAQLHGDENAATVSQIARNMPVIKAFRVGPGFHVSTFEGYSDVFAFLLDGAHGNQYGGTGHTADWELARSVAQKHRIILAGGLTPENVATAILCVRPYAVDVASGVESRPGRKDHTKLRDFVREVRRAEPELEAHAEESKQV